MAKQIKPLSPTQVTKAKPLEKEYSLADGNGLYLRIKPNGAKLWIFNYIHPTTKKRKNISLGAFPDITLASAREKTREMRQLVAEGVDPKTHRDNQRFNAQIAQFHTLRAVAEEWFEVKKHDVSDDYADDIWRSLELHVFPNLGNMPVSELSAPTVIQTLRPIEAKGALETVRRVCQRLNEIMTYAHHCGKVEVNRLEKISKAFKKPKAEHMLTIKPDELNILMQKMSLANIKLTTRCAFEFQLHTLTRPNECARAEWNEIDFENRLWIIGRDKMKMKRDHKIPLSDAALQLLNFMKPISFGQRYVFPSASSADKHMNSQSINAAMKRAGMAGKLVSHGIRSIGSTALNEQGFNKDAIELCLAHVDKNTIRDIYNNAEYLEERRKIMDWWSNFILDASKNANTIAKPEI
ncbi:tyrosine-type recombinase/integrase [Vibrio parahaemolyticus]|uniref:integrase domain-containing protein n=1 Tax=Vibrio parahaemolyticus TaxID=670 RepID=UPI00084B1510|nr:integrase domain-containing protein [Vibrio parahaemolyticus]EHR0227576.1 tyrosine-type recombinase/integrase [Vibrio parahaemolyticus]EHZ2572907.1 tyrosine-type recombinase/integrase [Vibrio parahaemolyticus]EHZ2575714.1 tyrosine-type recombinase/integrase [Vibrio parahaemolyticus]EIU7734966.1 tyrosine-type recombinase/integrase [Vibrio parahaemolyticus]EIZ1447348.1 tyrosine-type recombinase/integrase [Vibrio parahaemolyticus]